MPDRTQTSRPPARRPPRSRPGFSFVEVLFAVIILGVGFILVAAIFPVAIQQTQATAEDAAASAAAREAASAIASLPTTAPNPLYSSTAAAGTPGSIARLTLFPPTVKNYVAPTAAVANIVPPPAIVVPFTGPRGDLARANLVNASDPRYAYVPFYRRENGSNTAQLIVIAVTARNRPVYDPAADTVVPAAYAGPAGNMVSPHAATAADPTYYKVVPDLISVTSPPNWVGEGCALLTSTITGRSYRLGRAVTTTTPPTQFELDPGDNLSIAPGTDGLWGSYGSTATAAQNDVVDATYNANAVMPPSTLQPIGAYATVYAAAGSLGGRITLAEDLAHAAGGMTPNATMPNLTNVPPPAAVPGTFVIVADDYPYSNLTGPTVTPYTLFPNSPGGSPPSAVLPNGSPPFINGAFNGRIFRLGQPVPANTTATPPVPPGTFELDPQYMTVPASVTLPGTSTSIVVTTLLPSFPGGTSASGPWARVYLVGAGRTNALSSTDAAPAATLTTYTGPAQDTGVFSTFFPVQ